MAFRWISSTFIRVALLIAGTVLLTLGVSRGEVWFIVTGGILCVLAAYVFFKIQNQLREKSHLMLEAIRNRDYTFRLPVYGLAGGERVLQDTLNQFGSLMGEQKQFMEQRERFYEQILSSVTSGVIVMDENMKITIRTLRRRFSRNHPFVGGWRAV